MGDPEGEKKFGQKIGEIIRPDGMKPRDDPATSRTSRQGQERQGQAGHYPQGSAHVADVATKAVAVKSPEPAKAKAVKPKVLASVGVVGRTRAAGRPTMCRSLGTCGRVCLRQGCWATGEPPKPPTVSAAADEPDPSDLLRTIVGRADTYDVDPYEGFARPVVAGVDPDVVANVVEDLGIRLRDLRYTAGYDPRHRRQIIEQCIDAAAPDSLTAQQRANLVAGIEKLDDLATPSVPRGLAPITRVSAEQMERAAKAWASKAIYDNGG